MIADLLLFVPPLLSLYLWWKGDEKRGSDVLSTFLLTSGLAVSLKLLFRVGREVGLDPFAFPSLHSALASSLFFAYPHPLTLLYALLVMSLRVVEGYHGVVDVLGGFIVAGISYWVLKELRKRIGTEADRKALHYGIAVTVGYFSLFLPVEYQVILTAGLLLGAVIVYLFRFFPFVDRLYVYYARSGEDVGPLTLAGGLFLASTVGATPLAGFVLGYVDTSAAVFGMLKEGVKRGIKTRFGLIGSYIGSVVVFTLLKGFYSPYFLVPLLLIAPLVEYHSELDDNLILSLFVVGVKAAASA